MDAEKQVLPITHGNEPESWKKPLPKPPFRLLLKAWFRKNVRPKYWAMVLFRALSSVFDIQDLVWIIATLFVVRGTYVLAGDGYAFIAAGAMTAVPSLISIVNSGRRRAG